jgi:hypothetical protein
MADDPLSNALEVFSAPIEQLIIALGQGISQAQRALDQNSIQTQESLDTDPVLSQYRLQATWYQFPNVNMELKVSLAVSEEQSPASSNVAPRVAINPTLTNTLKNPVRLIAQPVSASYQTHFNYDAQAASTITLTIVPVPAPTSPDAVTVPPRMQPTEVQSAALASPAKFIVVIDGQGKKAPASADGQGNALRFDMNFNAAAHLWYVLQYAPSNASVAAIVVAVDDVTGSVRVINSA